MTTPDLPTFLTQRYDEQEAVARAASVGHVWTWDDKGECLLSEHTYPIGKMTGQECIIDTEGANPPDPEAAGRHIATHDPAYVLADLAAKREIVAEAVFWRDKRPHSPNAESFARWLLMRLAQPFANHPDFRPEWKL